MEIRAYLELKIMKNYANPNWQHPIETVLGGRSHSLTKGVRYLTCLGNKEQRLKMDEHQLQKVGKGATEKTQKTTGKETNQQ